MKSKRSVSLKAAAAVVAAAITATGMAGTAQAVTLNPDGLGQVLIYPYYTVRANADGNAYDSLLTVVNAKGVGKAVNVRFREGKAGHAVLDFNLYLSEYDVWTAAITQTADGSGAMIRTWDTSCTHPPIPENGQSFRPFSYIDPYADGEDTTTDRTKEGYVEIIEMADFARDWVNPITGVTHLITPTERDITHAHVDGEWRPRDCNSIRNHAMQANRDHLTTGTGGLFGNMTLINVNTARAVGYDAAALSGFYKGGDDWGDFDSSRASDTLWFPSGTENPNLSMAYPPTSTILDDAGDVVQSTWTDVGGAWTGTDWVNEMGRPINDPEKVMRSVFKPGLDAVSSVLMRSAIINEFNVAEVYAGATDWVVTMPTKNLYFDRGDNSLKPRKLFQREFRAGGARDDIDVRYYDREERRPVFSDDFCVPPLRIMPVLSWATNIFQFGRTVPVFHSAIPCSVPVSGYEAGWAQIDIERVTNMTSSMYGNHTLTADTPSGRTFTGLPVVGFAATLYNNAGVDGGSLGRVWASYVATVPHRYERNIQ